MYDISPLTLTQNSGNSASHGLAIRVLSEKMVKHIFLAGYGLTTGF